MELYVIRHGQTFWNEQGRLQGNTDIELNQNGINDAIQLGKSLENTKIDVIFSSPLKRAFKTAELIRGNRNIKIEKDERLKEVSFGVAEGIERSKWNSSESPYRFFFTDPQKYIPPKNGETLEQVCERTRQFVQEKVEPLCNCVERVVIVAHGALNSAIICYLEDNPIQRFWGRGLQKNCEVRIFEFDGKKWLANY